MKNEIDLAKIPARETARKTIRANFDGAVKDFEIRALTDGEKLNLSTLFSTGKDVMRTRNLYVCLLTCGLDIEQSVAAWLFDHANAEAVRVGDEIFAFSRVFEEAKDVEAERAEKNSAGEARL